MGRQGRFYARGIDFAPGWLGRRLRGKNASVSQILSPASIGCGESHIDVFRSGLHPDPPATNREKGRAL